MSATMRELFSQLLRLYTRFRWWSVPLYGITSLGLILLWFAIDGKRTRVILEKSPEEPVGVYVLDYGYHLALAMPSALDPSLYVKYGFGDWRYYALGDKAYSSAAAALLWATPSAFGRGTMSTLPTEQTTSRSQEITVARSKMEGLRARLDKTFSDSLVEPRYERISGLWFVPDDRSYSWYYNCNSCVRDWLHELGCECHGAALWGEFEIQQRD